MKYVTGIVFVCVALLPYVGMLRGGAPGQASPPGPVETLAILSPHRREVRLEYTRGFREWMRARHGRNVGIQWLDVGGTSKILKDIESRYAVSPKAPGVDILFGGGIAPYYTCISHGWLDRVDVPESLLAAIPPTVAGTPVYDPGRRWFGVALSGFGVLYNRPLVDRLGLPPPAGWDDLGSPAYFSWVSSGDPRSSGAVHMCYEIILQAYGFEAGWGLITRTCANVRNFGEGGGTAARDVASGDVAAAQAIDQYAQTVVDSVGDGLLVFFLPSRMTMIGPDAIGVLKGCRSPELAKRFVEYVLSPEGQRLLYQPVGRNGQRYALHRLPVRADLYRARDAPAVNPYEYRGEFTYDDRLGNRRWNVINELIGVCLIDAHEDLVRAWKRVIETGGQAAMTSDLCRPPVTAEEVDRLAAQWDDPRRRLEVRERWARECRLRYARLSQD